MTTVLASAPATAARVPATDARAGIRVALLGLGNVGSAVARLALAPPPQLQRPLDIVGALVRQPHKPDRPAGIRVGLDPKSLLDAEPDVVVEVLGGLEPARSLVLEAIDRGIPVVTANKSLLARHGVELLESAARRGVPLRYEASVVAGVPFLGTFDRRPLAGAITRITGVLNGTSHFILSRIEQGCSYEAALSDAQRRGFAEPDPSMDISGRDAAEKLAVLFQHFGRLNVAPSSIPVSGIASLTAADLAQARAFGGTIKPIATADWTDSDRVSALVGPSFVPSRHPLASIRGVTNGVCLEGPLRAPLFYSGPGAGPDATALTLLDDVEEAVGGLVRQRTWTPLRTANPQAPDGFGWFVRLEWGAPCADGADVADLLGAHGVWCRHVSDAVAGDGRDRRWLLTFPCAAPRLDDALAALRRASRCETLRIPVLESSDAD